jgi:multidrug efflux pump subunit AcrA (membrane-fusion protein)
MNATLMPAPAHRMPKGLIMNRRINLFFIAAFALAAAGCDNSSVASSPNPAPPAAVSAPATVPAKSANTADILSVLTVEHQVDVTSQRDGLVMSLSHDEGSAVKAGDVLGQIDDRSLQMELIKANSDLQVADNNRKYKEAELKAKSAALRRQQQLRALGLSSDADLETAEFEAKAAEYDLHGYEALVESGHAEINRLKLEEDQTRIHAPFSGVVVRRYIREGQAISKGDGRKSPLAQRPCGRRNSGPAGSASSSAIKSKRAPAPMTPPSAVAVDVALDFEFAFVAAVFRPPACDFVFELVGARHAVPADDPAARLTVAMPALRPSHKLF